LIQISYSKNFGTVRYNNQLSLNRIIPGLARCLFTKILLAPALIAPGEPLVLFLKTSTTTHRF
jgi:hypothetical protein